MENKWKTHYPQLLSTEKVGKHIIPTLLPPRKKYGKHIVPAKKNIGPFVPLLSITPAEHFSSQSNITSATTQIEDKQGPQ